MDGWVVAYDDADRSTLADRDLPLRHWARRVGSPLLDQSVSWVPASSIKALGGIEQVDLVLFRSSKPTGGGTWTRSVPRRVQGVLDTLSAEDARLAVEYTAAMPANSNALGRIGRLLDHVRLGIPTLYAVPCAGYEGRDEGRGQATSAIRGLTDKYHQRRIAQNQVLSLDRLNERAFHFRELGRWVPLYTLCLADTYAVPCAVVLLPEAVKTCPPVWRHSGAELAPLYKVMSAVLHAGTRLTRRSPRYQALRAETEKFVAKGTRARPEPPPEWTAYVDRHGNPNGSKQYADGSEHLPFSVTAVDAEVINGSAAKALRSLLVRLGKRPERQPARLPPTWNSRHLLIQLSAPPEVHWREKTYICRLLATELCFLRKSVKRQARPWAMSPDPRARSHVVAVPLPVTFDMLRRDAETDVYVRRWLDFADLLILRDGVFLGGPWAAHRAR